MAIFNSPQLAMQDPQYWDDSLPNLSQFRTMDDYDAAMDAYRQWLAGTPGGQDAGLPGQFRGMSEGEYQAHYLNARLQNLIPYATDPRTADHPNVKGFQAAMQSRAGIRPDEIRDAGMAIDEKGNQLLSPVLAAMFERWGIRPTPYQLQAKPAPSPTKDARSDYGYQGG